MGPAMGFLQPDRYFPRLSDIQVEADLLGLGLNTVLLDIDNTLRSRADGLVPQDALAWLARCKAAGVGVCLLSNNWHSNVFDLAEELDLPIVAKALKPLAPGYVRALALMHARVRESVVVGDQLFTDVVGAKALGMPTYMVAPLSSADLPYTAALRRVELALVGQAPPAPEPIATYEG